MCPISVQLVFTYFGIGNWETLNLNPPWIITQDLSTELLSMLTLNDLHEQSKMHWWRMYVHLVPQAESCFKTSTRHEVLNKLKKKKKISLHFAYFHLPLISSKTPKDCLRQFSQTELLTGSNRCQCSQCKCNRDHEKTLEILKLPPILVIHLKRSA